MPIVEWYSQYFVIETLMAIFFISHYRDRNQT